MMMFNKLEELYLRNRMSVDKCLSIILKLCQLGPVVAGELNKTQLWMLILEHPYWKVLVAALHVTRLLEYMVLGDLEEVSLNSLKTVKKRILNTK